MLTLKQFIAEQKNTHMMHVEDTVLYGGVNGVRQAIFALRSLRDMLKGNHTGKEKLSLKFDGCVHEDTEVFTNKGVMKIKDMIHHHNTDPSLKVMGRKNVDNDDIPYDIFAEVFSTSVNDGKKDWVEVTLEDGSVLKMTEDHEVYTTNRGWVEAKDLTEEDDTYEL